MGASSNSEPRFRVVRSRFLGRPVIKRVVCRHTPHENLRNNLIPIVVLTRNKLIDEQALELQSCNALKNTFSSDFTVASELPLRLKSDQSIVSVKSRDSRECGGRLKFVSSKGRVGSCNVQGKLDSIENSISSAEHSNSSDCPTSSLGTLLSRSATNKPLSNVTNTAVASVQGTSDLRTSESFSEIRKDLDCSSGHPNRGTPHENLRNNLIPIVVLTRNKLIDEQAVELQSCNALRNTFSSDFTVASELPSSLKSDQSLVTFKSRDGRKCGGRFRFVSRKGPVGSCNVQGNLDLTENSISSIELEKSLTKNSISSKELEKSSDCLTSSLVAFSRSASVNTSLSNITKTAIASVQGTSNFLVMPESFSETRKDLNCSSGHPNQHTPDENPRNNRIPFVVLTKNKIIDEQALKLQSFHAVKNAVSSDFVSSSVASESPHNLKSDQSIVTVKSRDGRRGRFSFVSSEETRSKVQDKFDLNKDSISSTEQAKFSDHPRSSLKALLSRYTTNKPLSDVTNTSVRSVQGTSDCSGKPQPSSETRKDLDCLSFGDRIVKLYASSQNQAKKSTGIFETRMVAPSNQKYMSPSSIPKQVPEVPKQTPLNITDGSGIENSSKLLDAKYQTRKVRSAAEPIHDNPEVESSLNSRKDHISQKHLRVTMRLSKMDETNEESSDDELFKSMFEESNCSAMVLRLSDNLDASKGPGCSLTEPTSCGENCFSLREGSVSPKLSENLVSGQTDVDVRYLRRKLPVKSSSGCTKRKNESALRINSTTRSCRKSKRFQSSRIKPVSNNVIRLRRRCYRSRNVTRNDVQLATHRKHMNRTCMQFSDCNNQSSDELSQTSSNISLSSSNDDSVVGEYALREERLKDTRMDSVSGASIAIPRNGKTPVAALVTQPSSQETRGIVEVSRRRTRSSTHFRNSAQVNSCCNSHDGDCSRHSGESSPEDAMVSKRNKGKSSSYMVKAPLYKGSRILVSSTTGAKTNVDELYSAGMNTTRITRRTANTRNVGLMVDQSSEKLNKKSLSSTVDAKYVASETESSSDESYIPRAVFSRNVRRISFSRSAGVKKRARNFIYQKSSNKQKEPPALSCKRNAERMLSVRKRHNAPFIEESPLKTTVLSSSETESSSDESYIPCAVLSRNVRRTSPSPSAGAKSHTCAASSRDSFETRMKRVWGEFKTMNKIPQSSCKPLKRFKPQQIHHWQNWTREQLSDFMKIQSSVSSQMPQYFSSNQNNSVDLHTVFTALSSKP